MNQVPRKILFVVTKSNWGGAQRYVYDLATSLPREQFDVSVAFGGTGKTGEPAGILADRLRDANVRTIFVKAFARDVAVLTDIRALFELIRIFRRERPDIVHLNSSKAGGLGSLAAKLSGVKKIVFTVHGLPQDEARNAFARSLIRLTTRLTIALCTDVIVISKENIGRIHTPKAHLVYNGAWPTELLPRNEARKVLVPAEIAERHEKDIWVLTNAELHTNKNLFTAIDAIARHNEVHTRKIFYVIVGDGELRKKLEENISHRKMREEVFLAGFIKDAARYLGAFDVFFLPSKKEGLPYVLLEAGLAELPVVASTVGGIPELIEDGKTGFLRKPDDAESFSTALGELSNSESLRQRLGENLMSHIRGEFSLQKMVRETTKVYEEA